MGQSNNLTFHFSIGTMFVCFQEGGQLPSWIFYLSLAIWLENWDSLGA